LACMIDSRDPCCPGLEPGETIILVIRPETSSGKSRPRGALLQSVVAVWGRLYSVSRRHRSRFVRICGVANVTLLYRFYAANPRGQQQMGSLAGAVRS